MGIMKDSEIRQLIKNKQKIALGKMVEVRKIIERINSLGNILEERQLEKIAKKNNRFVRHRFRKIS
jgi:hypothetical protein